MLNWPKQRCLFLLLLLLFLCKYPMKFLNIFSFQSRRWIHARVNCSLRVGLTLTLCFSAVPSCTETFTARSISNRSNPPSHLVGLYLFEV